MDSVFIFLCHTAGTALSLVIGFLFMKVLDCCLVRRHGKLVSLIGILGYGMVSTTVIFPQDMLNICFIVILFLLLNSILYKGKWVIKLSLIVILFPIFTALNFLSFDVTGKIFFQFYTMQDKLENAFFSNSQYLILIPFWLFSTAISADRLKKYGIFLPIRHGELLVLSAQLPLLRCLAASIYRRFRTLTLYGLA